MRYPIAAAAVFTLALGGAALAQNVAPPDNDGKTMGTPTGAATVDTGRSTVVTPVSPTAPVPMAEPSAADTTTGAAPSGAKPGVSGTGNTTR